MAFTLISKHFSTPVLGGGAKIIFVLQKKYQQRNGLSSFDACIDFQAFKKASQRIIVPENTDESFYLPLLNWHNVFPVFFLSE